MAFSVTTVARIRGEAARWVSTTVAHVRREIVEADFHGEAVRWSEAAAV